ncbi:MAG: competence/damage-inducible protein A [Christensenellaceae bacterium]|jgi:nicotinamide-nucleotide amidase|nr:competence/damage-inducible protein A [Christensenellaceae bacterium]
MRAEVISVGTELLMGQIVDSDAAYIAKRLSGLGIDLFFRQTVGDNEKRMLESIGLAASRSDVVILTGGLGPTQDDMTKQVLAKHLGRPMRMDEESKNGLEAWFSGRGQAMTPNNLRQAEFPEGALILKNDWGTAPGCAVFDGGRHFIVLPGPPRELEPMMDERVMPYLSGLSGETIATKMLKVFGIGESALEDLLEDLISAQREVTMATYAGFGEVTLRLAVKLKAGEDPEPHFARVEPEIRRRLGQSLYAIGDDNMPQTVAKILIAGRKSLSLAESCTGGMIAAELVAVPGISEVFLEGTVVYSNEAKVRSLGVSPVTLQQFGAVSAECALEMAEGMRRKTGSDYALAVTGIAGPDGGSAEKPVGLCFIAVAGPGGIRAERFLFGARRDRGFIRRMATLNALDLLRRELL